MTRTHPRMWSTGELGGGGACLDGSVEVGSFGGNAFGAVPVLDSRAYLGTVSSVSVGVANHIAVPSLTSPAIPSGWFCREIGGLFPRGSAASICEMEKQNVLPCAQ